MKSFIIGNCLNIIKKNKQVSEDKLAIIEYGLVGIYLMITKLIIIFIIALIIGYIKETIIFFLLYGILRSLSYGLHAKNSWICLVTSVLMFNVIPVFANIIKLNSPIKIIIGIIFIILMFKNSPADTYKKPIISKSKRKKLKYLSTFACVIYLIISIFIKSQFISNCLLFSMILQNILISPFTYKLFNLPYNNYINYLEKHPELNNL